MKPGDVLPFAELTAHSLEDPDGLEADAAMQRNAALVGQSNTCIGVAKESLRLMIVVSLYQ